MKIIMLWFLLGVFLLGGFLFSDNLNITGKAGHEGGETINCYEDNDCSLDLFIDCVSLRCVYPGTVKSYCDRVPITECINNDDCCLDICDFNTDNNCDVPEIVNQTNSTSETSLTLDFVCGNGVLEVEENCDGSLYPFGITCISFGYDSGEMGCEGDCISFNFDNCYYDENDNITEINESYEEDSSIEEFEENSSIEENSEIIVEPSCNEGTPFNSCSNIKPYYCNNSILIGDCNACNCNLGYNCIKNTCVKDECYGLNVEDCRENEDCDPVYQELFVKTYKIYKRCEMKECEEFSNEKCKEHSNCDLIYDQFCIFDFCLFKYNKKCAPI